MRERDLDEKTAARLASLLGLGDPTAWVALAYRVKGPGRVLRDPFAHRGRRAPHRDYRAHQLPGQLPRAEKAGADPETLVRKDHGLPPDQADQRPHRRAQ